MDKITFFVLEGEFSSSIKAGDRFYVRGTRSLNSPYQAGTIEGIVAEHYIFGDDNVVVLTSGTRIKLI
jgi:hypothetical protein